MTAPITPEQVAEWRHDSEGALRYLMQTHHRRDHERVLALLDEITRLSAVECHHFEAPDALWARLRTAEADADRYHALREGMERLFERATSQESVRYIHPSYVHALLDADATAPEGGERAPEIFGLSGAERTRLARADRESFSALCNAVADIVREHLGLVPVIPTAGGGRGE